MEWEGKVPKLKDRPPEQEKGPEPTDEALQQQAKPWNRGTLSMEQRDTAICWKDEVLEEKDRAAWEPQDQAVEQKAETQNTGTQSWIRRPKPLGRKR